MGSLLDRRSFTLGMLAAWTSACGRGPTETPSSAAPPPPSPPKPRAAPIALDPLATRVGDLRERFGPRGWTVLAERPFAVVGDGSPERVAEHARGTIRWAVEHLEAAYFAAPPVELVTIWLFETSHAYEDAARELFGEGPDTPYGWYSPTERALIMNIGTGGGTLVHEIVHPYMESNFPRCPDWFNEGLASLYEQSAERDGKIIGLTNWRLAGLQEALAAKRVPDFESLCESGSGFYTADPGTNYSQARYLCLWLQEHDLLDRYWDEFRAKVEADPSGHQTLMSLVGDGFRARWEAWVMDLRFG